MSNSKQKPIINNIDNLNLEIDYDKLAEAIIKAEEKAKIKSEPVAATEKKSSRNLFKNICNIIRNKETADGKMLSGSMTVLIETTYRVLAIMLSLTSCAFAYLFIEKITNMSWCFSDVFSMICCLPCLIAVFLFAVISWGAANDIVREKDKNYIASVFSGIVSFVALIVALIALNK